MRKVARPLVFALLVWFVVVGAAGCGSYTDSPEKVVEKFYSTLTKGSYHEASSYLSKEAREHFYLPEEEEMSLRKIAIDKAGEKIEVNITGYRVENHRAEVEVEITGPDLEELWYLLGEKADELEDKGYKDEAEIESILAEAIDEYMEEISWITEPETVYLIKEEGKWKINTFEGAI